MEFASSVRMQKSFSWTSAISDRVSPLEGSGFGGLSVLGMSVEDCISDTVKRVDSNPPCASPATSGSSSYSSPSLDFSRYALFFDCLERECDSKW